MATITHVMGEPWEPSPGIRAMLASIAKTQKALAPLATTQKRINQKLIHQQHLAGLTASLAAAQTAMKPLLDAIDRSGFLQIAAQMPSLPDFSVATEGWRKQSEQLRAGMQLLRDQLPADLSFPAGTLDQAEDILAELSRNPLTLDPSALTDELTPETQAQVEETVQVIEPALRDMDRAKARALVVAYVSVIVFVVSVCLSIAHPELAGFLTQSTGAGPLAYATGAGWLAGKIWDRRNPEPNAPDR